MDERLLQKIRRIEPGFEPKRPDAGNRPDNDDVPPPAPTWTPEVEEPDPDLVPDELPTPNPDENRAPPIHAGQPKPFPEPEPIPYPDPMPSPPPGPNPTPTPIPM
jgi:hypothetical protein